MSYMEQMRLHANRYLRTHGGEPATTREIAAWLIERREWAPERSQMIDQCADLLARAMREEHVTDPQGRSVRVKHVARIRRGGKNLSLWADMRHPSTKRDHMETSLQQRRRGIVGDCHQLKIDADSYNENWNRGKTIQLVFNFEPDLAELDASDLSAA
jgi:hypothetical protein